MAGTNEALLLITFVFLGTILLFCLKMGRVYVFAFSVSCIIVSNITVVKQVEIFGLSTSLGVVIYSLVYLATDICSEYGKKNDAYRVVLANIGAQIAFFIYIYLSIQTPAHADLDTASPLISQLFTTTPRITVAAIIAAIGAFVDVWIYEWLKRQLDQRELKGVVAVLIRNNLSTITGQAVNTALFFFIAFYGVFDGLLQVIGTALIVKVIIAFLDSPFLLLADYLLPSEWAGRESWRKGGR